MLGSTVDRATEDAAGLAGAIDALLALDPDTLDARGLAALAVELHRQQSRLAAATTRVTAAVDGRGVWAEDGSRSCGAWLARRCRLPLAQSRAEARLGRRLPAMPETRTAFGAGDITARHAGVLGSLNAGRTTALFARDEAELVDDARGLSWPEFCVAVDYWRQHADPDGVERDAAGDEAARRLHLSPGLRGTGILDGLLTPLARATVATALGRIEQELFAADWAQARARHGDQACVAHIARTPAQRRHDALVELAHRALAAPPGGRRPEPLVSVLVGYETFRGRVCQLADGTVITPGTVASLLGEAWIERVVFDGPSRVVDLGQARRFAGAARRALEIRDRHCTHPTRQTRRRAPTPTAVSTGSKPGAPTCEPRCLPNKTSERQGAGTPPRAPAPRRDRRVERGCRSAAHRAARDHRTSAQPLLVSRRAQLPSNKRRSPCAQRSQIRPGGPAAQPHPATLTLDKNINVGRHNHAGRVRQTTSTLSLAKAIGRPDPDVL